MNKFPEKACSLLIIVESETTYLGVAVHFALKVDITSVLLHKRKLSFYSPTAVFSIRSLFFFLFHFHGLKILPKAWKRLLRSAGGVLACRLLDLASPFLLASVHDTEENVSWAGGTPVLLLVCKTYLALIVSNPWTSHRQEATQPS